MNHHLYFIRKQFNTFFRVLQRILRTFFRHFSIGETHFSEIEVLYDIVIYVGPYLSSNRIRPLFFVFKAENQQEEVLRVIPRNLNSYVGVVNQPPLQWGGAGKRLLHTNFAPGYAPEPEQKPVCRQFSRCEDCPYPSHGFLCWSSEDDCMRTRMKN